MKQAKCNFRRAGLLFAASLLAFQLSAQERELTGSIFEADGVTPLIGATVKVKGSNVGTVSDLDGHFRLRVDGKDVVLEVSYMGFVPQEVKADARGNLRVVLQESSVMLNETVVTALGITREQKSLGYAVSKLGEDEVTSNLSNNWLNALDGKVAGLTMASAGAGPGSSLRVTLRGDQSLNYGSNEALFVVDGIPVNSGTTQTKAVSNYATG